MREAQPTCDCINHVYLEDTAEAEWLLCKLTPEVDEGVNLRPPIRFDYGPDLETGDRTPINTDPLTVDGSLVLVGSDCLIGPRASIYMSNHVIVHKPRLEGWQYNADVTIDSNVWLGGNAVTRPGVTVGDNSIIGVGAVVTHDIPVDSIVAGNPRHVIAEVPDDWIPKGRAAAERQ